MQLICGPCGFESREMTLKTIEHLHDKVDYIRAGIWKYRSDPKAYQGNPDAQEWIKEARSKWDFKYVVEVFNKQQISYCGGIADMYQVGSRNMANTDLLRELNAVKVPVLLKRHYAASLHEFVKHSEYLKDCEVTMCLRGILSIFPQEQRFIPDLTDIARLREITENKICYDVSHSACHKRYVSKLIQAAKVYDPEYIMAEVHPKPSEALSDAQQQLNFEEFDELIKEGIL